MALLSAPRRRLALRTILRAWYVFGALLTLAGVLNRLYIMPRFLMLAHARHEYLSIVHALATRVNTRLGKMVSRTPPPASMPMVRPSTAAASRTTGVNEMRYANAQTQTDDSNSTTLLDQEITDAEAVPVSHDNTTTTTTTTATTTTTVAAATSPAEDDDAASSASSTDALPLSYHSLRYLVNNVQLLPAALMLPGVSSSIYSANELALFIEGASFKHESQPGSRREGEIATLSQTKALAAHMKDDIRALKSVALTLQ
ncbi:uncharacterized protein V1518DRAFT_412481 [Limtongia smithiae]|uniref:uncharacterized protein n=1 Tax=Limtongia smithiae TaxID=1125753 RepID=UPI0034CD2CFC